jgi:hypothetical protein
VRPIISIWLKRFNPEVAATSKSSRAKTAYPKATAHVADHTPHAGKEMCSGACDALANMEICGK